MNSPPSSHEVSVQIPTLLRHRTGQQAWVTLQGRTIREVLAELERRYPGMGFHLCCETGELRRFVNVFVGVENVRDLEGLETEVPEGSQVTIVHSVAGG